MIFVNQYIMGTTELLEMINKLPADKKEVEDFISDLYSERCWIIGYRI